MHIQLILDLIIYASEIDIYMEEYTWKSTAPVRHN